MKTVFFHAAVGARYDVSVHPRDNVGKQPAAPPATSYRPSNSQVAPTNSQTDSLAPQHDAVTDAENYYLAVLEDD